MSEKFGFNGALFQMNMGFSVSREAWKQPGDTAIKAIGIWRMGREQNPTIIKFTLGSDSFTEWVPTCADLLAVDWIKHVTTE